MNENTEFTQNQRLAAKYQHQLLLLLVLWIGVGLRFIYLGKQGLFLDEASSANVALRSWSVLLELDSINHPRLYYLLLKLALTIYPLSEWSLRWLSATFSTLALATAIGIARRLVDFHGSLWVGWIVACSSFHIYYAQEAKMYGLLEFLWLASSWFLLRALMVSTWQLWLLWGFITALAIHTHFYGLLLWGCGALSSGVLVLYQQSWSNIKKWFIAQILIVLTTTPLAILLFSTVKAGVGGTWIPTIKDPFEIGLLSLFGFSPKFNFLHAELLSLSPWSVISRDKWYILAIVLTVGALVGLWQSRHRLQWPTWGIFTFGVLPLLIAFVLLSITQRPLWAYRPFVGAATWLLIGFGIGWARYSRKIAYTVLVALFILNLGSLIAYQTQWTKDYTHIAVKSWSEALPDDTILILDRVYNSLVWNFYDSDHKKLIFGLLPAKNNSFELRQVTQNGTLKRIYQPITCEDLPTNRPVALYGLYDRRFAEGEQWPTCFRQVCSGWTFNKQLQTWEKFKQNSPWCNN